MKKKLIIIFLMILLLTGFNTAVSAQSLEHQFELSIGSGDGYTEYRIGDIETAQLNYGFKSLLEFPLAVEMINLNYSNNLTMPKLNIGGISVRLEKNLNDDAGTFRDTDWVYTTGINNQDVIGTSPTRVEDITRWDLKIRNEWLPAAGNLFYTLHLGYKQDNYDLLSYNLEQTYLTDAFGEPAGTTVKPDGPNISYQAKYDIPYLGFDLKTENSEKLELIFSAAYSDWVRMEDEDNHLREDLTFKAEGEGNSLLLNGRASYNLSPAADIFLDVGYNKTEVEGSQDQFHSDGTIIRDIYYEAEQEYTNISLGLNWTF